MFKSKGMMFLTLIIMLMGLSCSGPKSDQTLLTATVPLLLEDHIDSATIIGSEVPKDILEPVEWRFDEPQPDWKPIKPIPTKSEAVKPVQVEDALRLPLTPRNRVYGFGLFGVICVELPDWNLQEWEHVEIRARTQDPMNQIGLTFNYTEKDPVVPQLPFNNIGDLVRIVTDGTIQTYRLSVDGPLMRSWEGPWTHLGIGFNSPEEEEGATIDILSIKLVPKFSGYADDDVGVRADPREFRYGRQVIYTHTPARLEYKVEIPPAARFVTDLGVLSADPAISFRISIQESAADPLTIFADTHEDPSAFAQHSIDLAAFARKTVTLVLETDSERPGTVALWGAPTIADASRTHDMNGGLIEIPSYRLVTSDPGVRDWTVCFSPEGETLLFCRVNLKIRFPELFVVSVAGGVPRRLTTSALPVAASRMNWSWQTGTIAFTGIADNGRASVWLIEPDGSNLREVNAEGLSSHVMYPSWYPDGRDLAVVDLGGGEGGVIKRIDIQDLTVKDLTDREEVLAGMPSVSPDGKTIAFAGQRNTGQYIQSKNRIWVLDDEGLLRELDPQQGRTPAWSPDGEWIVFESDRGSPNGHYAVFIIPRQGGQALQLTSYEIHANHPKWSPDGTKIAFSAALSLENLWRIALLDVPGR
jgi:hypothetical protein